VSLGLFRDGAFAPEDYLNCLKTIGEINWRISKSNQRRFSCRIKIGDRYLFPLQKGQSDDRGSIFLGGALNYQDADGPS